MQIQKALKIPSPALTGKPATHVFISCVASLLAMVLYCSTTHFAERSIKEAESASRRLVEAQDTTTAFVFNAARAHSVGLKHVASSAADSSDGGASAGMHIAGDIAGPDLAK